MRWEKIGTAVCRLRFACTSTVHEERWLYLAAGLLGGFDRRAQPCLPILAPHLASVRVCACVHVRVCARARVCVCMCLDAHVS